MPDLPTEEELLSLQDPELLIKPLDRSPANKMEYLANQYKLCRIEATELIRRAVRLFRDDPDIGDTNEFHIYTKVRRLPGIALSPEV